MAWTAPRTWVSGEVLTAALLNVHLRDNMTGTSAAVTNGTNVNAANTVAYQRCGSVIVAVSAVTTSAISGGATLFTLPSGYRPPVTWYDEVVNTTTGTVGRLDIATTGVVTISSAVASGETVRGSFVIPIV